MGEHGAGGDRKGWCRVNEDLDFFHRFLKSYAKSLTEGAEKDPHAFNRGAMGAAAGILKTFEDTFLKLKDIESKEPKEGA